MTLAPVVLFVYNRKEHTENTLKALEKNQLCKESELFIFLDGPKTEGDPKVAAVRELLKDYRKHSSFHSVEIYESDRNKGLANSVIGGVTEIINRFRRVIVLEDDLITGPDFLTFMNGALDFYEKEENVWSVSGYSFPMKALKSYEHDVFYTWRGNSWGWGTWLDRWDTVDWDVSTYDDFLKDKSWQKRFCRGGRDLPGMLKDQMEGRIDSWAVRWVYEQSNQNKFAVYPRESKIQNEGLDGSGTHCAEDRQYRTKIATDSDETRETEFALLQPERRIIREFNHKYEYTLDKKIKRRLKKLPLVGGFFE